MNEDWETSTVKTELRPLVPSIPFLELRVQGSYGSRYLPFLQNPLEFRLHEGNSGPTDWSVELTADARLLFRCAERPPISRLISEELELGNERFTVVDLRTLPPYRLVSLSAELGYRVWPLGDGSWTVGRPGRRSNTVSLSAASVSRTHARLEVRDKVARLVAEAQGALTAVNGVPLESGQGRDLQPNDMLQLGELLFRWEREERALFGESAGLLLRGLGACSVALGTARADEIEFRNENAKNLLFWMAATRADLPIERILEGYWPERPSLRQRKNLSHTLKALQNELGWRDATYHRLVTRSADTVRLETRAVESCDIWDLQTAIRQSRRAGLELAELVDLHPGPLLPHQQHGWVRSLRSELFLGWLEALRQCPDKKSSGQLGDILTRCLRDGDFEEYVYERAFEVARAYGLESLIPCWLTELRERLLAGTGDPPRSPCANPVEPDGSSLSVKGEAVHPGYPVSFSAVEISSSCRDLRG